MPNNHTKNHRSHFARAARRAYDSAMAGTQLLVRAARPLGTKFRERSGLFEQSPEEDRVWVHACSAGEMMVARRFIDCWRRNTGRRGIFLTAWTSDGYALAGRHRRDGEQVAWFPVDSRGAMRSAYECVRPSAVVLCEAELWPNHLAEAKLRGIPVFVINGRMPMRDHAKYARLGHMTSTFFGIPEAIFAQNEADGRRFSALGAKQIVVTGNMKFDDLRTGDTDSRELSGLPARPYILAASTHAGEEDLVIKAFMACLRTQPAMRLVIAPRHVQRSHSVVRLARRGGLRTEIWPRCGDASGAQCIVVDRLGVLPQLYAHAEFALVGKSLIAGGGQNFLEAVEAGCPVLTGPRTANFDTMLAPFLAGAAVWRLSDTGQLADAFESLAAEKTKRTSMAREARRISQENSGATEYTVREILSRL